MASYLGLLQGAAQFSFILSYTLSLSFALTHSDSLSLCFSISQCQSLTFSSLSLSPSVLSLCFCLLYFSPLLLPLSFCLAALSPLCLFLSTASPLSLAPSLWVGGGMCVDRLYTWQRRAEGDSLHKRMTNSGRRTSYLQMPAPLFPIVRRERRA